MGKLKCMTISQIHRPYIGNLWKYMLRNSHWSTLYTDIHISKNILLLHVAHVQFQLYFYWRKVKYPLFYLQFVNPVQPDFAQQHFISDNQQQPIFKPSQQNLVSNPNQQNLLFIPNQQQLMLIQKQKQPMFNLSQQQLVFSTTQPMTGFYSQQYAAQHNGHQQNVLPNPAQPGLSASLQGKETEIVASCWKTTM